VDRSTSRSYHRSKSWPFATLWHLNPVSPLVRVKEVCRTCERVSGMVSSSPYRFGKNLSKILVGVCYGMLESASSARRGEVGHVPCFPLELLTLGQVMFYVYGLDAKESQ
jgi:hypothetical protein